MSKGKKRIVNLYITPTSFSSLFRRISGKKVEDYDFSGIAELRQLLSNERSKILYTIKNKSPQSVYELSKLLNRDFKAVSKDLRLLEKFGFVKLVSHSVKGRKKLRPTLEVDELTVNLSF